MELFYIQLIIWAVSTAIIIANQPKPEKPKPASLRDFRLPTAEFGNPIPLIIGTVTTESPNFVWYGDLGSKPIKTDSGK